MTGSDMDGGEKLIKGKLTGEKLTAKPTDAEKSSPVF